LLNGEHIRATICPFLPFDVAHQRHEGAIRTGIAQALLANPKLIIVDEPTATRSGGTRS